MPYLKILSSLLPLRTGKQSPNSDISPLYQHSSSQCCSSSSCLACYSRCAVTCGSFCEVVLVPDCLLVLWPQISHCALLSTTSITAWPWSLLAPSTHVSLFWLSTWIACKHVISASENRCFCICGELRGVCVWGILPYLWPILSCAAVTETSHWCQAQLWGFLSVCTSIFLSFTMCPHLFLDAVYTWLRGLVSAGAVWVGGGEWLHFCASLKHLRIAGLWEPGHQGTSIFRECIFVTNTLGARFRTLHFMQREGGGKKSKGKKKQEMKMSVEMGVRQNSKKPPTSIFFSRGEQSQLFFSSERKDCFMNWR